MTLPAGIDGNWLRGRYLATVPGLVRPNGTPLLSEQAYLDALEVGLEQVEADVSIVIGPVTITGERYDITVRASPPYYQTRLKSRPVRQVTGFRFRVGNTSPAQEVPLSWVLLRSSKGGDLDIVPDATNPLPTAIFTWFWPYMGNWGTTDRRPALVEVDYEAGFADAASIPGLVKDAIGLISSIRVLLLAQIAMTQGFASKSVSQDGLSQSSGFIGGGNIFDGVIAQYRQLYADRIRALTADYRGVPIFGA